MSYAGLVKEITRLLNDTKEATMRGDAKDYAAYASCIARYRVLVELNLYIEKHKRDDIDDNGDQVDKN